ncbi:MAG: hypothetical protein RBU29_18005, partial [bacterium]|nr:hypothetical protein [bacterium]
SIIVFFEGKRKSSFKPEIQGKRSFLWWKPTKTKKLDKMRKQVLQKIQKYCIVSYSMNGLKLQSRVPSGAPSLRDKPVSGSVRASQKGKRSHAETSRHP